MNYIYYVAFSHEKGTGFLELSRSVPISKFDDIMSIVNMIYKDGEKENVKNVCITFYTLLNDKGIISEKKTA